MKNPLPLVFLAIVCALSPAVAERSAPQEITRLETTGGRVYEEIRSVKVTPSGIRFLHRDGAASVRFEDMPEATRARFPWDPAAAAAFDAKQAAAEKASAVEAGKMEAAESRRREAWRYLAGHAYKDDSFVSERGPDRLVRDRQSLSRLMAAGYDSAGAAVALAEIKRQAWACDGTHPETVLALVRVARAAIVVAADPLSTDAVRRLDAALANITDSAEVRDGN